MAITGLSVRKRIHRIYPQVPLQVIVWVILNDDDVMLAADGIDLPPPLQGDADACKTGAQQLNGSRGDWTHQMWVGVQSMKVRQHAPGLDGTFGCTAGVQHQAAMLYTEMLLLWESCHNAAFPVQAMQKPDLTTVWMVSAMFDARVALSLSCQTTTLTCAALLVRRSSK